MTASPPLPHSATAWLALAAVALAVASLPLGWWAWQSRRQQPVGRLAALTALTLFLTFDLIVFGAFTRLTDSGLGCPDWPGCYGQAHPVAAEAHIQAEAARRPDGPVTEAKAWIEMVHRYLAMAVGLLIVVAVALAWRGRRALPHSPLWSWATLAWVLVQGLFGRYTVTWKLYPAIVTAHLLGALVLLVLLVLQHESFRQRALTVAGLSARAVWAVLAVVVVQAALGGWVSTNYAVLACPDFPTCRGAWWPTMELSQAFTLARELGHRADGGYIEVASLVGIHWVHRLFALAVLLAVGWLVRRLWQGGARRHAWALGALLGLQVASGLSNVVLGWPLVAALLHSAGAAALVGLLGSLAARLALAHRPLALGPNRSTLRHAAAPR